MERIDFQTWMPGTFDGRPFGPGVLEALEEEAGVGRCVVMPEARHRPDNDGLAARIQDRPRLAGCAAVNPRLGVEAVEDPAGGWRARDGSRRTTAPLERAMDEYPGRLLGCCVVSAGAGPAADLARAAEEMEVPVTIHTNGSAETYERIAVLALGVEGIRSLGPGATRTPAAARRCCGTRPPPAGR